MRAIDASEHVETQPLLAQALRGWEVPKPAGGPLVVGVLPGEGIGPEVVRASLLVLDAIQSATDVTGIGPLEHGFWDRDFYARPQAVYGW